MKNQKNKYIKVRMTPDELARLKEESASYATVSQYVRAALREYSNVDIKKQVRMLNELDTFYRKLQNDLSWTGSNLNQTVKRANELAVAGLLTPGYLKEVLMPVIMETQESIKQVKELLDKATLLAGRT